MVERTRGRRGLRARLGRLFALQLAVIGSATVIGIYITQLVVEDLLARRALASEADHYWQLRDANPDQPLPNTASLRGYLAAPSTTGAGDDLPSPLRAQSPGFRRVRMDGGSRLVHISDRDDRRLYLVFEGDQISDLAFYFGIVPLFVVLLLLIYGLLFVAYRWSQAALSPIVRLARQLEAVDLDRAGSVEFDFAGLRRNADAEVATMMDALERFAERLTAAIERERVFTRDAGHELRTPLAVFKGSLDLLERNDRRPAHDREALARMRRTADGMESLLETLLLLARKESAAADEEPSTGETGIARRDPVHGSHGPAAGQSGPIACWRRSDRRGSGGGRSHRGRKPVAQCHHLYGERRSRRHPAGEPSPFQGQRHRHVAGRTCQHVRTLLSGGVGPRRRQRPGPGAG